MLVFSFNMGLYLSPLTILKLHENPTIAVIEKRKSVKILHNLLLLFEYELNINSPFLESVRKAETFD